MAFKDIDPIIELDGFNSILASRIVGVRQARYDSTCNIVELSFPTNSTELRNATESDAVAQNARILAEWKAFRAQRGSDDEPAEEATPVEKPRQLVPEELLRKLRPQTVKRIAQDIDSSAMSDHYKAPFRDLEQMDPGDIHEALRVLTVET